MEEANVSCHINKWTFDLEIEKLKEYSEKKKKCGFNFRPGSCHMQIWKVNK